MKVLGTACGLGVQGSGWIAGDGVVVTNAHVVLGPGRHHGPAPRRGLLRGRRGDLVRPDATTSRSCACPGWRASRRCRSACDAPRGTWRRDPRLPGERPVRRAAGAARPDGDRPHRRTPTGAGRSGARSPRCAGACAPATRAGRWWTRAGRVLTTIFAASVSDDGRAGFGVPDSVVRDALDRAGGPGGHRPLRALSAAICRWRSLRTRSSCARASVAALLAASAFGGAAPPEPPQGTPPDRTKSDTNPCLPPFRAGLPLPGPRHPPAARDVRGVPRRAHPAARGQLDRQHRPGPRRAARPPHRPALHARPPADLHARGSKRRITVKHGRPAPVQARPPGAALVEVVQRRALRALAGGRPRRSARGACASGPRSPTACATSGARARTCRGRPRARSIRPATPTRPASR